MRITTYQHKANYLFLLFILGSCVPNYFVQNTKERENIFSKASTKNPYINITNKLPSSVLKKGTKRAERIFQKNTKIYEKKEDKINQKAQDILSTAMTYLGVPYRYGGSNRNGIDCSSLVQKSFASHHIFLPRVSKEQAQKGKPILKDQLRRGDLVFFATKGGKRISHVGIILTPDGIKSYFIHVSSSIGVTISKLHNSYWSKHYVKARRVIADKG